jgi:hypothetical protein
MALATRLAFHLLDAPVASSAAAPSRVPVPATH